MARHPRTRGPLPAAMKGRLESAYPLALRIVESRPGCQGLFAPWRVPAELVFQRMVFFSATEKATCMTGAPAFNYFGHPLTGLCDSFSRLAVAEAAVLLIHEALHVAGLNEYPNDPMAMTPAQITRLVRSSCLH